jgi:hypothetical protein
MVDLSGVTLDLIKSGAEKQELREDIPASVMSSMVLGLLIAHNQRLSTDGYNIALGNSDDLDALNETFTDMILSYIKKQ